MVSYTYGYKYLKTFRTVIRLCREHSITKFLECVEQTVAEFLIELSPALFGGVQLR